MKFQKTLSALAVLGLSASAAHAANILVITAGNADQGTALTTFLTSKGYTVTLDSSYTNFAGTEDAGATSLSAYNAVLLFPAFGGGGPGDMTAPGQTAIANYVTNGGSLVTSEWTDWTTGAQTQLQTLADLMPFVATNQYSYESPITYTQASASAALNAGVPGSFTFATDGIGGTEVNLAAKSGATVYYTGTFNGGTNDGLIGWNYAAGRVYSFSTIISSTAVSDPNFSVLLGNTVAAAVSGTSVPEPASLGVLGVGALTLLRSRSR